MNRQHLLIVLLMFIGTLKAQESNFTFLNELGKNVYFTLGSNQEEALNTKMVALAQGQMAKAEIPNEEPAWLGVLAGQTQPQTPTDIQLYKLQPGKTYHLRIGLPSNAFADFWYNLLGYEGITAPGYVLSPQRGSLFGWSDTTDQGYSLHDNVKAKDISHVSGRYDPAQATAASPFEVTTSTSSGRRWVPSLEQIKDLGSKYEDLKTQYGEIYEKVKGTLGLPDSTASAS